MKEKRKVLIVDDERKVLVLLSDSLREHGFTVCCAANPHDVFQIIRQEKIDAVILDLLMPEFDGIQVLKRIKRIRYELPVIMLSGHGTIGRAVESIKEGAFDFLEKPVSSEKIAVCLNNALKQSSLESDNISLLQGIQEPFRMIGKSQPLKKMRATIDKVADSELPVLIWGESGSGKELVARAIHFKSPRAARSFVPLNCSAIPEELMESELFGHEKGAFTGAHFRTAGLFEQADKGTLFLDEISDMSMRLQPKFLRALETMRIKKVGGTVTRKFDVRLISASNCDLHSAIKKGLFRNDLYYRLAVIHIQVPSLRERAEDIPVLVNHFAKVFCATRKIAKISFHPDAMQLLMGYEWPGNIRQLKNLVEKIVVLSEKSEVCFEDVAGYIRDLSGNHSSDNNRDPGTLNEARKRAEQEVLLERLIESNWDYKQVADDLKISRATLFNKIKEYKIPGKRLRKTH